VLVGDGGGEELESKVDNVDTVGELVTLENVLDVDSVIGEV
jgi:hypothetical protein